MSERVPLTVIVYDGGPQPHEVRRVLVEEYDLRHDGGDEGDEELHLDEAYQDYEVSAGTWELIAEELVRLGASFVLWQDPSSEGLGDIVTYVNGDRHDGMCDGDGDILVSERQIDKLIRSWDEGALSGKTLIQNLKGLVGWDVRQRVELMKKARG